LKGKGKAELGKLLGLADVPEYERRTDIGEAEKPVYGVAGDLENAAAELEAQDEKRKG